MGADRIRIGCGSASNHDRVESAVAMADKGDVDYISCDCLSERSIALHQMERIKNPDAGFDHRLPAFIRGLRPFLNRGGVLVGNFGAANVDAAAAAAKAALIEQQWSGKIAVIHGDSIRDLVLEQNLALPEIGATCRDVETNLVSANAYIGAEPIIEGLSAGAKVVIGGRIADPSLFVGPICYELGWDLRDWDRVAKATVAGHLLECGVHSTGGNHADPPYRPVDGLDALGFPLAEVSEQELIFSKQPGSGGVVNGQVARTQLGYEIHDPRSYLTPDVTADLSRVSVREVGLDRVAVDQVAGRERPETLKVVVGLYLGWKVVAEISYGGEGCVGRAKAAADVVRSRLKSLTGDIDEIRYDLIGYDSLFGRPLTTAEPTEVRLRVAARSNQEAVARAVAFEVEYLYFGPAAAAGVSIAIDRQVGVTPAFIAREAVTLRTEVIEI
jgi:Acyclic terpene utilisation family protein AtuA